MNEWLQEEETNRRKISWWVIALIIAAIGLAFLGWHFYSHGWTTGNQTKL